MANKTFSKWQNQINLFENTIKSFAKFLKTSEEICGLDFNNSFPKSFLVLEMDERIQILQKILPAEKYFFADLQSCSF